MGFSFPYSIKPANLCILSLVNIYRSIMGVVNIVFTASMLLLAIRYWPDVSMLIRCLLMVGIIFFPVFQPLLIYFRSRNIVAAMPGGMSIAFDNQGLTIRTKDQVSPVPYSDLKSVIRISGMLILYTTRGQGYILNRQILGNKEKELYSFLKKQVGQQTV